MRRGEKKLVFESVFLVQKPFGQKMYELQGLKTGFVDQIFECK
jgi:hypothetical protein